MSAADHERFAGDVGAYVLGALPEAEAAGFQRHLRECEACQEEALRLRPAVEALPRSVARVEPPASLKESLMETVRQEAARTAPADARRPRRGWSWPRVRVPAFAAAAALAAGLAIGIGVASLGGDDPDPRTIAAQVDGERLSGAHGTLLVREDEPGRAVLRMSDLPPAGAGRVYEVWVSEGGRVRPESLFVPHSDGTAVAGIASALEGADAVLVTRERRGGVANPTEDPVISVPL
jgi:anti-sigma-K factor RskA